MKTLRFVPFIFLVLISCSRHSKDSLTKAKPQSFEKTEVFNLGTFHMGFTSDANKIDFDENDLENVKEIHVLAQKIAAFKPSIILVERSPQYDDKLQAAYQSYLQNPGLQFANPSEIELLAYEVGRLSGAKRIYGIDHRMGYNYNIGQVMDNKVDPHWHDHFYQNFQTDIDNEQDMVLLDKIIKMNQASYLDAMIVLNAEMLSHVGSSKGFEGADEATKFYQRNLRMYTNMNRLEISPSDRVFILMGATHTAYFRDFIQRSPKYDLVDIFEYLK